MSDRHSTKIRRLPVQFQSRTQGVCKKLKLDIKKYLKYSVISETDDALGVVSNTCHDLLLKHV